MRLVSTIKLFSYTLAAPWLRRIFKNQVIGKPIKGTQKMLYYDKSQHLGFLFATEINYEPAFSRILLDQVKPGTLVFEIGANIGQYSLQISEKLGPTGKLICVEPDSDNFKWLSNNIYQNKCNNVILVNKAISDKVGRMKMYKDTTTGGRMSSLIKDFSSAKDEESTEEVEVTTMSLLYEDYGIPSFVKVDVEGAESNVFIEPDSIQSGSTYIVEVRQETLEHIFTLFTGRKFNTYILDQHQVKVDRLDQIPGFANLLFVSQ